MCYSLAACRYARKVWKLKPWFANTAYMPFSSFVNKGAKLLSKEEFVLFMGLLCQFRDLEISLCMVTQGRIVIKFYPGLRPCWKSIKAGSPSHYISSKLFPLNLICGILQNFLGISFDISVKKEDHIAGLGCIIEIMKVLS